MNTISKLALSTIVAGVLCAAAADTAGAQQSAGSAGLLGTWTLVSETAHRGDKTTEPLGRNPLGSMMLDSGGRFLLMIARAGLPNFAANRRDAGSPEENRAVLAGSLAFFGTYSVSEADRVLTLHVEASTFPNWIGSDQKRYFSLAGDEMKWTNRTPAIDAEVVELVWKRAR